MKKSANVLRNAKCDLCGAQPDVIYDDKTRFGPWGHLCAPCQKKHGIGIGTEHKNEVAK